MKAMRQYDKDPQKFHEKYQLHQKNLQNNLLKAKKLLKQVNIDYNLRVKVSEVCSELDVDGLRGDIVSNRAAKALAAFEGRTDVTVNDVGRTIILCLRHRLRKDPLETIDSGYKVNRAFSQVFGLEMKED